MLPVLGFFNKTEWRLFPEYSLKISEDNTNITLSIDVGGNQKTLIIPNENLAKTTDAIINDSVAKKNEIKKPLPSSDAQFEKLIETYNDAEWIPTILMIGAEMKIDFKAGPTSSVTPSVSVSVSNPVSGDLNANILTKINDALGNTIATDLVNSALASLNKKTAIVPIADNLSENVMNEINNALNSTLGGKRNPDRERVYKLPIQKRRTDNYYNYE